MDAATGRKRWIRPRSPRSYEQFTSPVVADGRTYVSVSYESLSAVDAATGSKLWEMKNYASPHASAVVADGTLPGSSRGAGAGRAGQDRAVRGCSAGCERCVPGCATGL